MENSNTSSTMRLVRAREPENAFPTPPPRQFSKSEILPNMNVANSPTSNSKLISYRRANSTPPEHTNDRMMGSGGLKPQDLVPKTTNPDVRWNKLDMSKKRSQYFEREFAFREPNNTAKDRVGKDSVITIEVKLNCCLDGGEQQFHVDFSFALSEIYQRPASCIMIMVCTEFSILLHGTSEPAYHLTVTALSSEIAATKNKRSAHLIQKFMNDFLDIPASRGLVKFEAVTEENLATNGLTALQEIQEIDADYVDGGLLGSISRQRSRRNRDFSGAMKSDREKASTPMPRTSTPFVSQLNQSEVMIGNTNQETPARKAVKKRKSILSFFGM